MKSGYTILLLTLLVFPFAVHAVGPVAPCGGAASPAFAKPDTPPTITVLHANDLDNAKSHYSGCTGWDPASKATLVVALAGSFRFVGTIDGLLARIGSVSTLSKVQYWSTTSAKWRPVAYAASALTEPNAKSRRNDFLPSEFKKNASFYYWENDSRSGEVIIRVSVRERTTDRAVIVTENITPVRSFFVTLFPPGTIQGAVVLQRMSVHTWGVYLVSRTLEGSSGLAKGHEDSYVNRAVALYRQIAGIRTDQEPPSRR